MSSSGLRRRRCAAYPAAAIDAAGAAPGQRRTGSAVTELERDGDVLLLHLGDAENRFNPASIAAINEGLDAAEAAPAPRALVTVAGGKIWSNGLDLEWMLAHPYGALGFVDSVQRLLARVLTLPMPCVAAIQGHAFAGGAMLALAHDLRVMRADRGFVCLPEVDIQIPFTAGMSAMIQSRLTPAVAHQAMTTGRRYGGTEAAAAGIVDRAVAEDEVRSTAVEMAQALAGKHGPTLAEIKRRMYAGPVAALLEPLGAVAGFPAPG